MTMRRVLYGMVIIFLVGMGSAVGATRQVKCDVPGQTITKALKTAKPGDTIQVTGICKETVTITTDRLTLDGGRSAVIDGGGGGGQGGSVFEGLLTIDGAQGVVITGFTIQQSPADGILGQRGAAFRVLDTIVEHNTDDGLQVSDNATVQLAGFDAQHNGDFGIVAVTNSSVVIAGAVKSSFNETDGIFIGYTSTLFMRAGTDPAVTVADNGRDGISLFAGGTLRAAFGTLSAERNKRDGFGVVSNSTFAMTGEATASSTNNTRFGLVAALDSHILTTTSFSIKDNGEGLRVNDSSVRIAGATIEDNATAVTLIFGARANVLGSTITGTIDCDGTELLVGAMCSSP
jgi:hypothetical protein